MSDLRPWWVISPEMSSGSYGEPPEIGHDVAYVEASTKREAIRLGVKRMEANCGKPSWGRGCQCWPHEARRDNINPFAGVTVELSECHHGKLVWMVNEIRCDVQRSPCAECDKEEAGA